MYSCYCIHITIPAGATPIEEACTEERYGEASPMEEVYGDASPTEEESEEAMPDAFDRATPIEKDSSNEFRSENVQSEQPQPVDNMVERQIGGKVFKLGRLLNLEEREEVAAVISRHLDAFASPRCIRVDCGRHARHRPRFFVPPSYHGRQGSPSATKKEEVQRRTMPRHEGRDAEAAKRWAHQGDTIP